MTPFSLSMVAGAMLSSMAINRLKRYRVIAIVAALLMSAGAMLITIMTPSTNLLQAILILILTGIGIGPFFTLPMVAVQNALPESHLGISSAAVRYLAQMGATLGIAIVGTAITSTVSGDLMSHLATSPVSKLALSGALSHGFLAVLVFALIALVTTFLLKERLIKGSHKAISMESAVEEDEEFVKELVHA